MKFINYKNKREDKGFFSIKDDQIKSFRIKKLFNELPILDKLKKRKPKIYKEEYKYSRCNKEEKTLMHLWKYFKNK